MNKLNELGTINNGESIPKKKGVYPAYGGNGIIAFVNEYNYPENTVIIGRVGAQCGSVHFCETKCWVTDNALAFLPKSTPYFSYLLLQMINLNNFHIGSSQPLLTQTIIKNIECDYVEDCCVQKKIAELIYGLDSKISNNNKIISELESMAKTIYDYWFLQFDFPDENGKPYKSSGGKMVWNEELKREIPEGWSIYKLKDISHFHSKKYSGELNCYNYIGTDNMLSNMNGVVKSEYFVDTMANEFEENDILLSNIRPYFKKIWCSNKVGGCSSDVLVIRTTLNIFGFLYYSLASDNFFKYNMAGSKGSKMPRGDKKHIMFYPVLYNESLVKKFNDLSKNIIFKVNLLREENQELVSLRDFLLPMLMNGQVTFKESK